MLLLNLGNLLKQGLYKALIILALASIWYNSAKIYQEWNSSRTDNSEESQCWDHECGYYKPKTIPDVEKMPNRGLNPQGTVYRT